MDNSLYSYISENSELPTMINDILTHLEEKFPGDDDKKVFSLIATIGNGFNQLFSALPNVLITSLILESILTDVKNVEEEKLIVANDMITFIKKIAENTDNDIIVKITTLLKTLSEKMNAEMDAAEQAAEETIDEVSDESSVIIKDN